jgi:hypothetical protein
LLGAQRGTGARAGAALPVCAQAAQPTLLDEAKRWLGQRPVAEADATTEDLSRGQVVTRRLYGGAATAAPDGWQSLRTVLRVET